MISTTPRSFAVVCTWIYGSVIVLGSLAAAYRGWSRLSLRYELDYGEGPIIWQVLNVFDSHRVYAEIHHGPLVIWNYPPLYLVVVHMLHKLGPDLLGTGRVVSLCSALGVAVLLCAILAGAFPLRWGGAARIAATATGLLYLCADIVLHWIPIMRVDFLGLFATYLGLFVFLKGPANARRVFLAFFFFFVAIWTKQTFLAAPVACLIVVSFLAPKLAARVCAVYAAAGLVLFGLCERWTSGGFALHLIPYNVHRFSLGRALEGVGNNLFGLRLLLTFCATLPVVMLLNRRKGPAGHGVERWRARLKHHALFRTLLIEGMHFTLAFAISFTYGKVGSNVNYFLEWTAAAVVLCGCAVGIVIRELQQAPQSRFAMTAAILFAILLAFQMTERSIGALYPSATQRDEIESERQAYLQIMPLLQKEKGPVISEDMVLLTLAGKDVVFEPATMKFLGDAGKWDSSGFRKRLEAKEFPLIVVTYPEYWEATLWAAIQENYELQMEVGHYQVFRPRAASAVSR